MNTNPLPIPGDLTVIMRPGDSIVLMQTRFGQCDNSVELNSCQRQAAGNLIARARNSGDELEQSLGVNDGFDVVMRILPGGLVKIAQIDSDDEVVGLVVDRLDATRDWAGV